MLIINIFIIYFNNLNNIQLINKFDIIKFLYKIIHQYYVEDYIVLGDLSDQY